MLVYVEELFTAFKATYNLKGKTIILENLFVENKNYIEMQFNPESINKRLLAKYKGISFWLSSSGKLTIFNAKKNDKQQIKVILVEFYKEYVENCLNNKSI